jgi:hypothetical protein
MNVAEHLERHLGTMEQGWSSKSLPGVQVCWFRDQPDPGTNTLSTLGLSNTVLSMPRNRSVRQELLITVRDGEPVEELAKLLLGVTEEVQRRRRALLRGDVVPLGESICAHATADALYAAIPVVFPDALATLRDSSPPTVIVWLIPIRPPEAELIRASGWSVFEDRLEATEADLFDLCRESVV